MYYLVGTTKKWQVMSSGYLVRKLSLNGRTNVSVKVKSVYAIPQENKKNAVKMSSDIETLPGDSFISVVDGEAYQPFCCLFILRYQEFYGMLKSHFDGTYLESIVAKALKNDARSLEIEMTKIKRTLVEVAKIDASSPEYLAFLTMLNSKCDS